MTSARSSPPAGAHDGPVPASPGGMVAATVAEAIMNEKSKAKTPRGTGIRHLRQPLRRELARSLYIPRLTGGLSGAYRKTLRRVTGAAIDYHSDRAVPTRSRLRIHAIDLRRRRGPRQEYRAS